MVKEASEHFGYLLLIALQSTVYQLPFLAGSIAPFSKNQPWLHDSHPNDAAYLEI